jgi:Ca-activated chloride channel family protein
MNEIEFGSLQSLNWLWLVVAVAVMMVIGAAWARRSALRFASQEMLARVLPPKRWWLTAIGNIASLGALLLLVLCLVDPRWGEVEREIPQRGIEVMFVLDVSRSMLAEDATPSRLERAKQMIKDAVDEMGGDRVGLTVFAGQARQRIPMTNHYEDFKQTLDEVGPNDIPRGGSRLGDAIEIASEGYLSQTNDHRAMVILTDGEDQESEPRKVAEKVHQELGIRIFTIGLGDLRQGARVPIDDDGRRDYLQYEGQQVWSKLDGKLLTEIAQATSGAYIPAGTKQVNMADVYYGYIANVKPTDFDFATINRLEARYQWLLAPALLLLLIEIAIGSWPTRRGRIRES